MEQFNICSTSVESSRVYTCIFIYTRINNCSGFWGSGGKNLISANTSSLKLAELVCGFYISRVSDEPSQGTIEFFYPY